MPVKKKHKPPKMDRKLVALDQEHELRYWTRRFGCSRFQLRGAVKHVGNSIKKVEKWLAENGQDYYE